MKRTSRVRRSELSAVLPAVAGLACGRQVPARRAAPPAMLPLHLPEAGERIAQGRDVLALRLSCAALDLQGALGLAGSADRIEDARSEMNRVLGELRSHIRSRSA